LEARRREEWRVKGRVVDAASRGEDEEGFVKGHGMNGRNEKKSQRFEGGDMLGSAAGCCGRKG
jgi:hypothetical protein